MSRVEGNFPYSITCFKKLIFFKSIESQEIESQYLPIAEANHNVAIIKWAILELSDLNL